MNRFNLPLILGIAFISFFIGTGIPLIGRYTKAEIITGWDITAVAAMVVGVFLCGIAAGRKG